MISAILQYSTLDFRFLEVNLRQLSKNCEHIIIPICSHFFNGQPENEDLLNKSIEIINQFPKAEYFIFPWKGIRPSTYYHNLSRALGTDRVKNEWLLFLDADEILEDSFRPWFETIKDGDSAWVFGCYWYFREPIYRAKNLEEAGILIRNRDCYWRLYDELERQQLYQHLWDQGKLKLHYSQNHYVLDLTGNVMLHHFSWVRDENLMLKKVENWGHHNDRNWVDLVKEEFSRPFNGKDFIHGYEYDIVENKFKI